MRHRGELGFSLLFGLAFVGVDKNLGNITYDFSEAKTLGYHPLVSAYFMGVQFAQETKKVLEVSAKNEMTFFAGQIYYNLTEKFFADGRVLEVSCTVRSCSGIWQKKNLTLLECSYRKMPS
ncbi:uncharacterized protein LOC110024813 [Phalaenopsis equestris]|uniref:uncharacterized protein LOC110024813 n=1 Tax=Phalaenopsis equestris TaxID=78828 RepID=UPI0009E4E5F6|nr:uncharacterized protein LOC110024813 [Phalaenopsis equestris]